MAWRVVIAGGGFGGFYAARTLERVLPAHSAEVTLVSPVNYMLYTPLLPGAAGGTLEPRHVVVPLREELRGTDLRLGSVAGADPDRRSLHCSSSEGEPFDLTYDQLIVALGSVSRTLPIPGLEQHALSFKDLPDAIALRNRVLHTFELAEAIEDETTRAEYLTYVFVGAGYAGLEGLAGLQDFAVDAIDLYPRCRVQGMRWLLVEAQQRVMPEISASLAEFAARELRGRGIEVRVSTTLETLTERSATLSGGDVVPTRTLVWTAGVKPHPAVSNLGLPLGPDGRIVVDRCMRVDGRDGVWAIGDAAAVPDPANRGQPTPPTAQHALRQGRRVARNVAAALAGGRPRPFRYRTLGAFVDMGRYQAVASTLGIRWRGWPAWFLARTYHLAMMPGLARKARLLIDWNVALLFGRDSSEFSQLSAAAESGAGPDPSPLLPLFDSGEPTPAERVDEELADGLGV